MFLQTNIYSLKSKKVEGHLQGPGSHLSLAEHKWNNLQIKRT